MRIIALVLVFGSIIGTSFMLISGVYVADFFCAIMALLVLLGKKEFSNDYLLKSTFTYVCIMLLAAVLNMTLSNTIFINYFRIFTEGLIVYAMIKSYLNDKKSLNYLTWTFVGYAIYFLVTSRSMLSASSMIEDNFGALDFGIGRNSWGFTNLLTIIILSFIVFEVKPQFSKYILISFPLLLFNIYFSTSRFSLITVVIFFFFMRYWMGRKIKLDEVIMYGLVILFAPTIMDLIAGTFDAGMLESSKAVADDKSSSTLDDLVNARIWELNLEPIINRFISFDILGVIIGDGISICHGVFAHTFLSTGIIGLVFFCSYNVKAFKFYWNHDRIAKFAAFVIFAMMLNDFVANARFIILMNTLYYMTIMAYLQVYIECKNSKI